MFTRTNIQKMAYTLCMSLLVCQATQACMISFENLLKQHPQQHYERIITNVTAASENVVVYIGADWCKFCGKTKKAIQALLKEFPDIVFIMINSDKYPSFKIGKTIPKLKFYLNGILLAITDSQDENQLRALLKKYYR